VHLSLAPVCFPIGVLLLPVRRGPGGDSGPDHVQSYPSSYRLCIRKTSLCRSDHPTVSVCRTVNIPTRSYSSYLASHLLHLSCLPLFLAIKLTSHPCRKSPTHAKRSNIYNASPGYQSYYFTSQQDKSFLQAPKSLSPRRILFDLGRSPKRTHYKLK
jgi:hypothetical protein